MKFCFTLKETRDKNVLPECIKALEGNSAISRERSQFLKEIIQKKTQMIKETCTFSDTNKKQLSDKNFLILLENCRNKIFAYLDALYVLQKLMKTCQELATIKVDPIISIKCTWQDSLTSQAETIADLEFERASVIFNYVIVSIHYGIQSQMNNDCMKSYNIFKEAL